MIIRIGYRTKQRPNRVEVETLNSADRETAVTISKILTSSATTFVWVSQGLGYKLYLKGEERNDVAPR